MKRSEKWLGNAELMADGGRPGCPGCGELLEFGTDGQGRTIQLCECGYHGYLASRMLPVES